MTDLKLVPKPEGFELRDRRSSKTNAGSDWTPRDALYSASQDMTDAADAVTVIWREKLSDGRYVHHRSNAGPNGSTMDLTITALGTEMGWSK